MEKIIERNRLSEQYLCAAKKNFIEDDAVSYSNSKMLIGHISDIHSDWRCLDNAFQLFDYFKPDFVIHTGDIVKWNLEDDFSPFIKKANEAQYPVYNCIGNHDTFNNSKKMNCNELNDLLISPFKSVQNSENGHYFADFEKFKVRLIVINDYDNYTYEPLRDKYAILQEQCDWLVSVLKDALQKDYSVIIASHESEQILKTGTNSFCQRFAPYPWGKAKMHIHIVADIVNAFIEGSSLNKKYRYEEIGKEVEIDVSFEKQGTFICYLNGHFHGDFVGFLPDYPNQLSLCITCSGCQPEGYHNIGEECSDLARIPGTVSEDAVNFYTVDLKNRTLIVVRFGATVNDKMEHRFCETFYF